MKPIIKISSNRIQTPGGGPPNPRIGEMYLDDLTGEVKMYDGIDWIAMAHGVPMDTNARFKFFKANDISYAKITDHKWWEENHLKIHDWLDDSNAGYFIKEFGGISFFEHKFATAFKLTWG